MTQMHVATLQQSFSDDIDTNIDRVEALGRERAGPGAKVILPAEFVEGHYFCKVQKLFLRPILRCRQPYALK